MTQIPTGSIDLVVTSPPYPMIEMWDEMFGEENQKIHEALDTENGALAFELMNQELDRIWNEVFRVLTDGGIACINIGDATRKIGQHFQLYPNHSRILHHCRSLGFQDLPCILWRKPSNAPNKFMGSGMLPPGAYVTLEHEYILILRKGGIKKFNTEEDKINRRKSAFFWEERNVWFSDMWVGLTGVGQKISNLNDDLRKRSAAYPFELAYRLINMFSVKGDTVLDPFFGTGTTMIAAMVSARNSIGYEIEQNFSDLISDKTMDIVKFSEKQISKRLRDHKEFITSRLEAGKEIKYINHYYKFPVITRQEENLFLNTVQEITKIEDCKYEVKYNKPA